MRTSGMLAAVLGTVVLLCGVADRCGGIFGFGVGQKLVIASAPEGATVKIDGVEKGKTPLTLKHLDVEKGQKQVITCGLKGYETATKEIVWNQPEMTIAVTLAPAAKARVITVKTIPDGAKVYIDGKPKGETPLSFQEDLADGAEFNLLVQARKYDDMAEKVTVPGETIMTLTYNLKRKGGKAVPELDQVLLLYEKKWRSSCHTYSTDDCSFDYSVAPGGEVTNVQNVSCKFKDITGCTKRMVQKMTFPPSGDLRSDSYTWKGSN
jgi:hypothetical protein